MEVDAGELFMVGMLCLAGGFISGVVGAGGGILFVPAMAIFLDMSHLEAESTSLLIIAIVCGVGALRQHAYRNVDFRLAGLITLLAPPGVALGVIVANLVPERALQLAFAALALLVAAQLVVNARRQSL